MRQNKGGVWVSWNENLKYSYDTLYTIETEDELKSIVGEAKKIRFFGSKQSSADIAAGSDTLIDITSYNNILNYNEDNLTITVQSGILLKDLIEAVEAKGWCIPCLPDINTITIGGALATGTHGTSGKLLCEYMVNCRLVLEDGSIKVVNDSDDLMNALRVSVGTLGVMSTVTFKCEPNYTLHIKEGPENDSDWLPTIKSRLNNQCATN